MKRFSQISEALKYIDRHIEESITLEALSEKFFLSPFYFHRLFSMIVGKSLAAYIRDRRILYACEQLCNTEKTILDIALDSGFTSAQSFSRTFRAVQGVSPSEYRMQGYQPVIVTADELIMRFTNRLRGGIFLYPNIINRGAMIIAGTQGDGSRTGEVWNAFEKLCSEKPLNNALSASGYEIRVSEGDKCTVYVGYSVLNKDNIDPAYSVFELPASKYASFDVYVSKGYESENSAMEEWLQTNQEGYSERLINENNPFVPTSKLAKASRGPMGGYRALAGAVSQIFVGVAYIFVCLKALGGAFSVGRIVQYVSAVIALSDGLSKLIEALGDLRNNNSFLGTVFEFLDMPNKMEQGEMTVPTGAADQNSGKGCDKADKGYEIEFRNVSFKYPGQENYALRNVSMKFQTGKRLAVVGMNGSGKTTFIKLLCRLYDPTEGEIMLNGIDIRKYNYHEYMQLFSVVFQDFRLLSFELGQNVAGSRNVDLDKADQCLRDAGFGICLDKLPLGLSTAIYKDFDEKGVTISGGEAQKVALARALYKDAPFLILDEPTAALDPVAEFEVYNRMNQMIGEKTAIFISHRLSSCRFCQDSKSPYSQDHEILVFHEGRLIQRGSHDTLVSDRSGMYYRLWNAQAQYYEVKD